MASRFNVSATETCSLSRVAPFSTVTLPYPVNRPVNPRRLFTVSVASGEMLTVPAPVIEASVSVELMFNVAPSATLALAVPGRTDENREVMFRYGKVLLREGNPVLHDFLLLERQYCSNLLEELAANMETPNVAARMEELRTDLALNEEALRLIAEPELS